MVFSFICDIDTQDFKASNVRYEDHLKNDHNMWQYIWLVIHLRETDPTTYSGTEMHVAPYLAMHSPHCMPIKKSRAILGKVRDKATLPTLLKKIEAMGSSMDQALDDMRKRLDKTASDVEKLLAAGPKKTGLDDGTSRTASNLELSTPRLVGSSL